METKKLLVAFDPKRPEHRSSDFLVVVLEGTAATLLGIRSKKPVASGLMAYVGREIKPNDLFAKLVDTGRKIESVEQTLRALEHYIEKLQEPFPRKSGQPLQGSEKMTYGREARQATEV